MEYLVAGLIVLLTASYAVFIAVKIEKGETWALEVARAISMLDPQAVNHHLREQAMERQIERVTAVEVEPVADRLAA
jgi:hypothetical protein